MFNLQLECDRPHKISSQNSDHVLRVRLIPQKNAHTRTLPLRMAIALDTSQSMSGEKLNYAKESCRTVVRQLRDQDQLSLASFSSEVKPLLDKVSNNTITVTDNAINQLKAEGVTRADLALNWLKNALPPETETVRVGILITDGHPTNNQGKILENLDLLINQTAELAQEGIILCTIGLGNANNFNTEFLVNLSDQGKGAFLYAETPEELTPQLQERLTACQTIITEEIQLQLQLLNGSIIKGFCQMRPEYLPLEETAANQLTLSGIRADQPTDILLLISVPPLAFGQNLTNIPVITVTLNANGMQTISETASIKYTNSYREAQEINEEVNKDRLFWIINQSSTELTRTQDPNKTGELLVEIQVAAMKSGQTAIANQTAQQLEELQKQGKLNSAQTTGLLRDTRKLGGKQ